MFEKLHPIATKIVDILDTYGNDEVITEVRKLFARIMYELFMKKDEEECYDKKCPCKEECQF